MSLYLDDAISDDRRMAELHDRVSYLESIQLAEQAEAEAALDNQYEVVKSSRRAELAKASDLLFAMNQRTFRELKLQTIPEDLYCAVAGLISAAEIARNLLAEESRA